jgi:superfamily II DNA or RNA helicase
MIPESVFLHGTDGKKTREWVIKQFEEGKIRVLVSTLLSQGVDIPRLDAIVMAAGGASKVQTIQRAGRALRIAPGKKKGMIIDFKDTGWPLRNHYLERLSAYIAEYGEEIVKGK